MLAKAQKESAFAPLSDFEANLANFVVKRPDLFGTVEDEVIFFYNAKLNFLLCFFLLFNVLFVV